MSWGALLVLALVVRVISEAAARKATPRRRRAPDARPGPLEHRRSCSSSCRSRSSSRSRSPGSALVRAAARAARAAHGALVLRSPRAHPARAAARRVLRRVAVGLDLSRRPARRRGARGRVALCRARKPDAAVEAWVSERIERIGAGPAPSSASAAPAPRRGDRRRRDARGAPRRRGGRAGALRQRRRPGRARLPRTRPAASPRRLARQPRRPPAAIGAVSGCAGRAAGRCRCSAPSPRGCSARSPRRGSAELWLRWLIAPPPPRHAPLLRRALAAGAGARAWEPEAPEPLRREGRRGGPVEPAVLLHAALLLRPQSQVSGRRPPGGSAARGTRRSTTRRAGRARERAASLGASGAQAALGPLARAVEEDLAATRRAARAARGVGRPRRDHRPHAPAPPGRAPVRGGDRARRPAPPRRRAAQPRRSRSGASGPRCARSTRPRRCSSARSSAASRSSAARRRVPRGRLAVQHAQGAGDRERDVPVAPRRG